MRALLLPLLRVDGAAVALFQCMQRGEPEVMPVEHDYEFSNETVFDQPGYPKLYFVEDRYANDPTNWFVPNKAAVEAMLRSAGFVIEQNPEREVYWVSRGQRYFAAEPPPRIAAE